MKTENQPKVRTDMETKDEIENQTGFFSLAELAALDTSEVKAITSLLPAVGIYTVKGVEVKGGQREPQEGKPPLFYFNFVSDVVEFKPADKSIDPETVVGRKLIDSFTLWPAQFQDMIGLLKGRYKAIGLSNDSPSNLGGVEGAAPGWLDNIVGHVYKVKVTHAIQKGEPRARFTYVKTESEEAEGAAG